MKYSIKRRESQKILSFALNKGQAITYDWYVTGSYDINVLLYFNNELITKDSRSQIGYNEFIINDNTNGNCDIYLDNNYSTFTDKEVSFNYQVHLSKLSISMIPIGSFIQTFFGLGQLTNYRINDKICTIKLLNDNTIAYIHEQNIDINKDIVNTKVIDRAMYGSNLFFNNHIKDSEIFFKNGINKWPLYTLGYSIIGYIKAVLTWDDTDLNEAFYRLDHVIDFNINNLPSTTLLSWKNDHKKLTIKELEALLLTAEASILKAVLYLLDESMTGIIKAGLSLTKGWKHYSKAYKNIKKYYNHLPKNHEIASGIEFGVGSFNVIISILPPIILKLVKFLGFPSNFNQGEKMLYNCATHYNIRSPMSILILLFIYIVVPSFCTTQPYLMAKKAKKMLELMLHRFPTSSLFLLMKGRLLRNQFLSTEALNTFKLCASSNNEWIQLQHMCAYEIIWCYWHQANYHDSIIYLNRLYHESDWSKGTCKYMLLLINKKKNNPNNPNLNKLANECIDIIKKKGKIVSGKRMGIEHYVIERCKYIIKYNKLPIFAIYEMIYMHGGFNQMNNNDLHRVLHDILTITITNINEELISCLLKACIYKCLKQYNQAEQLLQYIYNSKDNNQLKETYVIPFSLYELAILYLGANLREEVIDHQKILSNDQFKINYHLTSKYLKLARKYNKDYHFKLRLLFRIHLANNELRKKIKQQKNDEDIMKQQKNDEDITSTKVLLWEQQKNKCFNYH